MLKSRSLGILKGVPTRHPGVAGAKAHPLLSAAGKPPLPWGVLQAPRIPKNQMNQYDTIADAYRDSKQLPFREFIERYTLFELLGDIRGGKILDMACGDGFYTRLLKRAGASEVTGVDVSIPSGTISWPPRRSPPSRRRDRCESLPNRRAVRSRQRGRRRGFQPPPLPRSSP